MRLAGILLIVFGVFALAFQSVTFFTTERAVDAGPLKIDVQKPHTIVFHPIVGIASLAGGAVILATAPRARGQLA